MEDCKVGLAQRGSQVSAPSLLHLQVSAHSLLHFQIACQRQLSGTCLAAESKFCKAGSE